jgi:glycosyltransferase involved in cell wall biosynthesis
MNAPATGNGLRIGVLVVAYNAETTLLDVLDRIPRTLRTRIHEILVQDDHSTDNTFEVASKFLEQRTDLPLTLIRHPRNLGYGGNQKAGYRYAIDQGWDVVVLLHGDGQYAPECMGDLLAPLTSGDADAVFGSRMMTPGAALTGGMPRYKYIGNRILTTAQNALTGLRLSEWHSGYRAYRVATLAELDIASNSDGFDFDTEIILQLRSGKHRITEVPIPTYYGDEICRVNGMAYAKDVMVDTLRHRLGRMGLGRGDVGHSTSGYQYKPSTRSSHGRILALIDHDRPARILDIGCGPGWLAAELRERGHCVVGVDAVETDGVRSRTDAFFVADLSKPLSSEIGDGFDIVIAGDVIEHVADPERLLSAAVKRLTPAGHIVISVPNFAHWYPRLRTALGRFDYDQFGILDRTHLRMFTRRTLLRTLDRVGLEVEQTDYTGLPLDALGMSSRGAIRRSLDVVDRASVSVWPTMFAYQVVVRARLRQSVEP